MAIEPKYDRVIVTADLLYVRSEPTRESKEVDIVKKDDIFEIETVNNGFAKLHDRDGWIMLSHTEFVDDEDEDEEEQEVIADE